MKQLRLISTTILLLMTFAIYSQNNDDQKVIADAEKAKQTLTADPGLANFFDNASGYVIFPNIGEGALVVGGAAGHGVVYERGKMIGMASLRKLDVGIQAGGQALTEIIFFETKEALNEFKQGEYELSAEASAIALDEGAATSANYNDGVVVFLKPKKGLMIDLSVGGQKFQYTPIKESN